jgi:hypothetical protein
MSQGHLQEAHRTIESRHTELERFQRKKDPGDVGLPPSSSSQVC